jgi:hypothetical protein
MNQLRFNRTKNVAAASLIALVVAAAIVGISTQFVRPAALPMSLTAGSGFTVSSTIYGAPACAGTTVPLSPGAADCAVFTVRNNLTVPISVQSLSMAVTSSPSGCPATDFSLPAFAGNLTVPGSGTSTSGALPISLIDTPSDQDACAGATIAFSYTGTAQYTDVTTTALAVSPTAPTSGQPVTLTATVVGANGSNDPALPSGAVTFNSCSTSDCASTTPIGTGSIGTGGAATLTTSSLTTGTHYLQAVYTGTGTDYTGSSSAVTTVAVGAPVTAAGSTKGATGAGTSGRTSSSGSSIAFTGADIAGMVVAALLLIAIGSMLVVSVRRRRKVTQS